MATRRTKPSPDPSTSPEPALPPALLERTATTPDDPSAAILRSAGELLARKSPSEVSLREIAAHAGVNYGLIHRHFGTKDELVLRLFQAFSDYGGSLMRDTDSVYTSLRQAFTAESGAFAEIFAWVILDRVDPSRVWGDRSVMHEVTGQIREAWEHATPPPPTDRAFDPRVVATLSALVISVWEFYAPYVAAMGDYEERDPADVKTEVLELLQLLVAVTRPG
jgi:AcrR family transcriptional regulator